MRKQNNHYNKTLKPFAQRLRTESTKSEITLWHHVLKNKQMLGFQFLRQRPIDKYIADFFCKELMLVIELDGITHTFEEVFNKDIQKQKDLELLGYTLLRFNDEDVMKHTEAVARTIEEWIKGNHADKIRQSKL